ncbi:TPA: hypothetical protein ACH3X3_011745 [Trebouxia sp. C0006]
MQKYFLPWHAGAALQHHRPWSRHSSVCKLFNAFAVLQFARPATVFSTDPGVLVPTQSRHLAHDWQLAAPQTVRCMPMQPSTGELRYLTVILPANRPWSKV